MDLGLRLKLFRVAADLKQREIAERLGVSLNYVSMLERGRREPTVAYLREFAKTVEVPTAALLWDPTEAAERKPELKEPAMQLDLLMNQFAAVLGVRRRD